jgi:hypothetical protein
MSAITVGSDAPGVAGDPVRGAHGLIFYKVTCSVTQMAAPPLSRLGDAFPGAVVGVGQDPQGELDAFAAEHGWRFPQVPDPPPYAASDAYGIASAPTLIVVDADGRVADVVESWDRDGMNRGSASLAALLGRDLVVLSTLEDGLPDFKPG